MLCAGEGAESDAMSEPMDQIGDTGGGGIINYISTPLIIISIILGMMLIILGLLLLVYILWSFYMGSYNA